MLSENSHRFAGFDVLRSLALLFVLLRHVTPSPGLTDAWMETMPVAVDMFFTLSGFLLGGVLFREYQKTGTIDGPRFLARRSLRLWPSYFALYLCAFIAPRFVYTDPMWPWAPVTQAFFIQNYFHDQALPFMGFTWSIALEEQFYILLVGLAVLVTRYRQGKLLSHIPWFVVAMFAFGLISRWFWPHDAYFKTHARLDNLFFGVFLGYVQTFHPQKLNANRRVCFWLGLGSLTILSATGGTWQPVMRSFTPIACGLMIIGSIDVPVRRWLAVPCSWVANRSYSIFLWHGYATMLALAIAQRTVNNWWVYLALYLTGSLIIGWIMAELIELPANRLRERLLPRQKSAAREKNEDRLPVPDPVMSAIRVQS